MEHIKATPEFLKGLKKAYKAAEANHAETFTFEGNEYVVGYAKYLIEFLEGHFKTK